jgi:hypothetical protein
MKRGEDWALNARDRGPAKKLARDYVDSTRHPTEYYLYFFVVIIVLDMVARNKTEIEALVYALLFALILVIIADVFFIKRGLRKLLAERMPGTPYPTGLTWYTFTRTAQPRRMRVPKPAVRPGDKI